MKQQRVKDSAVELKLIWALFFFSGISGLVYQIVWTRMLMLIFGNTMLATSTVLTAFMAGLASGSFVSGKYVDKKPRALVRIYALLEAGIGLFALIFPLLLTVVGPVYSSLYQGLEGNIVAVNLMRFGICFVLILVPTFLMGATLPVLLKRFARNSPAIGPQVGMLYGLNTAGAVVGALVCGFLLLRLLGMQAATLAAVGINLAVAAAAWILAKGDATLNAPAEQKVAGNTPDRSKLVENIQDRGYSAAAAILVLIGIGISGFCALAYEVIWTRMLNLFFHNTVYSFTTILATFLAGIALGSLIYAKFLSRLKRKVWLFLFLEIGIGAAAYLTPFIFTSLYELLFSKYALVLTVLKAAVIMMVPTILMGIALPLAVQICQRGPQREGDSVGTVYAVNTVGSILGAFSAGFIFIPNLGIHKSVILVAGLNILAGVLALFSLVRLRTRLAYAAAFVFATVFLFLGASSPIFRSLYQKNQPFSDIRYYKEGKIANVVVYDFYKDGYKDLYLNGIEEASSRLWHVQLFKMLGILPAVVHHQPDDALMIAFGAGMSAGACLGQVTKLDCAELNPDIHQVAKIFTQENLDVLNNPKLNMIFNDGRNYLLLAPQKYSLIISDATNPLTFDSWPLYTREFYELCKKKLKPHGVFCQWVPIPLPSDAIKVILKTFKLVFPHTSVWSIYGSSQCLMLATPERLNIDYQALCRRLAPILKNSGLAEYGVDRVEKFLSFFLFGEDKLEEMLRGFDKINTDDLPQAHFHPQLNRQGIQTALDLLKYQESILPYLTNIEGEQKSRVQEFLDTYLDLARLLNRGFLTNTSMEYEKARLLLSEKNFPEDANVTCMLEYNSLRKEYFLKRLEHHPKDALAHNSLGFIYMKEGRYQDAVDELKLAVSLKPDFANAHLNLAQAYIGSAQYDEAVEKLLDLRELNPTGKVFHKVEKELDIIHILRKIRYHTNDPNLTNLYTALGRAYLEDREFVKAARAVYTAAKYKPDDPKILEFLAAIYESLELLDQALEIYRKMAELLPADAKIKEKVEELASIQGDGEAKLEWLSEKISLPEDQGGHPAECFRAMREWDTFTFDGKVVPGNLRRAAHQFEKVIAGHKDHMHVYSDAAVIYEALGQFQRAYYLWKRGLEVSPGNRRAGNSLNRLALLERLRTGNPSAQEKIDIYNNIGVLYWQNREFDLAIRFFKKVLEIDPRHANTLANLGANYIEVGKYGDAVSVLERALQLDPDLEYAENMRSSLQWLQKVVAEYAAYDRLNPKGE